MINVLSVVQSKINHYWVRTIYLELKANCSLLNINWSKIYNIFIYIMELKYKKLRCWITFTLWHQHDCSWIPPRLYLPSKDQCQNSRQCSISLSPLLSASLGLEIMWDIGPVRTRVGNPSLWTCLIGSHLVQDKLPVKEGQVKITGGSEVRQSPEAAVEDN